MPGSLAARNALPIAVVTSSRRDDPEIATAVIRRSLEQLGGLLDDASVRLTVGIESLASLARDQDALLNDLLPPTDHIARQIEEMWSGSVTALQFHDIASQILNGVRRRLSEVDADTPGTGDDNELSSGYQDLPSRPNPVMQVDLAVGSVEFF